MRPKALSLLLALMLCIGAFALPMTAYAAPADDSTATTGSTPAPESTATSEPTEDDSDDGTNNNVESSLMDKLFAAMLEGAFTPDGTGSILDYDINYDEDKQFYTITTAAGNIFYLIIDGKRENNNVYFLNAVTEQDLIALAEKAENGTTVSGIASPSTCSCESKCEAGAVNTECPVCKNDLNGCIAQTQTKTEEPTAKQDMTGTIGMIVFIVIGVAAVAGVGYYIKIWRPKKQAADQDEFETEDYGEGFNPDAEFAEPKYTEDGSENAYFTDEDEDS